MVAWIHHSRCAEGRELSGSGPTKRLKVAGGDDTTDSLGLVVRSSWRGRVSGHLHTPERIGNSRRYLPRIRRPIMSDIHSERFSSSRTGRLVLAGCLVGLAFVVIRPGAVIGQHDLPLDPRLTGM